MATDENKSKGYIKVFRSLLDWEWYGDINTRLTFMHMLIRANYADQKFEGKVIPRGSFVSSRAKLSAEIGISERNLRTALNHLKMTGEVTSKSYSKYTIYKVENYDLYQATDQQSDRQVTSNRPASDQQPTTIKEIKKERNQEDDDDHSGQAADDLGVPFDFDEVVQREFSPEVGQALQRFRRHWTSKKPTAAEEMNWIQVLKSLPNDKQRLRSIEYSSGGSGKWYRDLYLDGIEKAKPKKIRVDIEPNLPDWYDVVPTDKATPEEVEEVLRLQRSLLHGGSK